MLTKFPMISHQRQHATHAFILDNMHLSRIVSGVRQTGKPCSYAVKISPPILLSDGRNQSGDEMEDALRNVCIASVSLMALSACSGGGGGGGGSTTTPTTPTPTGNSAPVIASRIADQTGSVGFAFAFDASQNGATFSDADGDALTYAVAFAPAARGLSAANQNITGTPNSTGDITITVTATDPSGASVSDTFIVSVGVDQNAVQAEFNGAIDLENLLNYEAQTAPAYITEINDDGNPITDAGATLGRVLFYDTSLSIDGTVSCASCHDQSHGFSDPDVVSFGVEGGQTRRHSMRLINTRFAQERDFFWDERANSHEAQETMPLRDHNEMGFSGQNGRPDFDDLLVQMEATEYYEELFRFAYLSPDITEGRIQDALAQFVKSIWSFDSRFDQGRAQVNNDGANFPNFTAAENAGKELFLDPPNQGGAGCAGCHRPPEFDIAPNSGMNGVFAEAGSLTTFDLTNTRSPSLRDLVAPDGTPNGPFMHDGSLDTLRDVIDHYDRITEPQSEPPLSDWRDAIDNRLFPNGNPQRLNLTEAEKQQLEAFLRTLTGSSIYTDVRFSNPF